MIFFAKNDKMKNTNLILILIFISSIAFSQEIRSQENQNSNIQVISNNNQSQSRKAFSLKLSSHNILMLDYEKLTGSNFGLFVGVVPLGIFGGFKVHFRDCINSSSIGFKIGVENNLLMNYGSYPKTGLVLELRTKKVFTMSAEAGISRNLGRGYYSNIYLTELYGNLGVGVFFGL